MIAKRIYYIGRVQGVGFRYECKRIAMGFDVKGNVQNLDDGRVQLCVVGEEEEVEDFLKEILVNSSLSHHILEHYDNPMPIEESNAFNGFSIIQ